MTPPGHSRARRIRWLVVILVCLVICTCIPYSLNFEPDTLPSDIPSAVAQRFKQADQYIWPKIIVSRLRTIVNILAIYLVVASLVAVRLEVRYGQDPLRRWPVRIGFLLLLYLGLYGLSLPSLFRGFFHSQSFGITHLTFPAYLKILMVSVPTGLAIFLLKYLLVFCCMAIFRSRWWLASAVAVCLLFQIIPEIVSRKVPIDPVTSFSELPDGAVREAMQDVTTRAGQDGIEFLVEDRSARATTANMYMTGRVGREYVVMTDTLLQTLSPCEIAGVFAHELGHKVTRPITVPLNMTIGIAKLLCVFYIIHLVHRRRMIPERSRLQAMVHIMLVVKMASQVIHPFSCAIHRFQEREADTYALELMGDPDCFRGALHKIGSMNLEPYSLPDWVYYTSASHPVMRERLQMTARWSPANTL